VLFRAKTLYWNREKKSWRKGGDFHLYGRRPAGQGIKNNERYGKSKSEGGSFKVVEKGKKPHEGPDSVRRPLDPSPQKPSKRNGEHKKSSTL